MTNLSDFLSTSYTGFVGSTGFTGSVGFTGSQSDIGFTASQGPTNIQANPQTIITFTKTPTAYK